jgi:hypothetical protein
MGDAGVLTETGEPISPAIRSGRWAAPRRPRPAGVCRFEELHRPWRCALRTAR